MNFEWAQDGVGSYSQFIANGTATSDSFSMSGTVDFGTHLHRSTHTFSFDNLNGQAMESAKRAYFAGSGAITSGTGQFANGAGYISFVGDEKESDSHSGILVTVYFDTLA